MNTCIKCKTAIEPDTRFCDECGTEQPRAAAYFGTLEHQICKNLNKNVMKMNIIPGI